jgi:hypothetical protein
MCWLTIGLGWLTAWWRWLNEPDDNVQGVPSFANRSRFLYGGRG